MVLNPDVDEAEIKETDMFDHPDIYFQFGLSNKQRKRFEKDETFAPSEREWTLGCNWYQK